MLIILLLILNAILLVALYCMFNQQQRFSCEIKQTVDYCRLLFNELSDEITIVHSAQKSSNIKLDHLYVETEKKESHFKLAEKEPYRDRYDS